MILIIDSTQGKNRVSTSIDLTFVLRIGCLPERSRGVCYKEGFHSQEKGLDFDRLDIGFVFSEIKKRPKKNNKNAQNRLPSYF